LRPVTTVTSFHHQPEAQHPKSSAIHKLPADYPIFGPKADMCSALTLARFGPIGDFMMLMFCCPSSWYAVSSHRREQ
jgi:hypothetical protein